MTRTLGRYTKNLFPIAAVEVARLRIGPVVHEQGHNFAIPAAGGEVQRRDFVHDPVRSGRRVGAEL